MNLEEFIISVNSKAFKLEDIPDELIENYSDFISFFYPARKNRKSNSNDIIFQFIEEYESCFNLISHISFNDKIEEDENYIHFGWSQEDLLVIEKKSKEIITIDYAVYGRKMFSCAKSTAQFMKAFIIGGFHDLFKHFNNDESAKEYFISKANMASNAAGGLKYLRYWNSLNNTNIDFDEFGNEIKLPPPDPGGLWN